MTQQTKTQQVQNVRVISKLDFIDLMFNLELHGATFVTMQTSTIPTMNKTNNPFSGNVKKFTKVNGQLNFSYQNAVNNQRDKEGIVESDFIPKKRFWGEHMTNSITNKISKTMISHTKKGSDVEKHYIQLRPLRVYNVEYAYIDSNIPLTESEIEEMKAFFPKSKKPSTQQTNKEIKLSDYNIDNIVTI